MEPLLVSNLVLWTLLLGLAVVVFALARQIGVLHDRIAPAGALTLSGGLKAGERVPDLELQTLRGEPFDLAEPGRRGRGILLFFLSPVCPVCKSLLPVLKRIARQERRWLDVVFASDGDAQRDHQAFVEKHGLEPFAYVLSQQLGMVFQVGKLPYAVLVDERGILVAKGLVNSREHIESLFEAHHLGVSDVAEYIRAVRANEPRRAGGGE